jgi:ribosome biogenesis GTPase A
MTDFNETGRLVVDYDSVSEDIGAILDEVHTLRTDSQLIRILGDGSTAQMKSWETSVKKRLTDPFSLAVIGDFKRGKSTLINAILGKAVAPTSVTPETVTINRISYSDTPRAEAVLKNGKRAKLVLSELKSDQIKKVMSGLPSEIDYIDIREDAEILKEICIVDTPGIGDLLKAFDEQVKSYLVNADAVIYVVSAKSPLSLTEQAFLSASVLPQSFSRILIALNMADCLEDREDIEKIIDYTDKRVKEVTPNAYVYAVSGLDEYCRRLNLPRPVPELSDYLEDCFESFRSSINNDILLQRDVIKTMRALSLTRLMLQDITARINLMLSVLANGNAQSVDSLEEKYQDENSDLMKAVQKRKSKLELEIDEMRFEAHQWMNEFMERLKAEIKNSGSRQTADLEKYFQFFMMDKVKEALIACTNVHQKQIGEFLEESAKNFALSLSETAFGSINTQIADCIADISWTNVDTATTALSMGLNYASQMGLPFGLGGLTILGQAVAGFLRQKSLDKRQADYLTPLLQEYDSITGGVLNELDSAYSRMKQSAAEQLDSIYSSQMKLTLDAAKQAKASAEDQSLKSQETAAYLNRVLATMARLSEILKKYE